MKVVSSNIKVFMPILIRRKGIVDTKSAPYSPRNDSGHIVAYIYGSFPEQGDPNIDPKML